MKTQRKQKARKIALERIYHLFNEAEKIFPRSRDLANRYVQLARKIGMRHRVRIPKKLQRRFCKHCYTYLVPGVNCRIRLRPSMVIYYCLECKRFMRFPHRKEER